MKKEKYAVLIAIGVIAMILMPLASATVRNNDIASIAIGYNGQSGETCKEFVQKVVREVGGELGLHYTQCYLDAGMEIIEPNHAMWGGIIQISHNTDLEGFYGPGMHSAIVLENDRDGNFTVVDSNYVDHEIVGIHDKWNPFDDAAESPHDLGVHFYRLGTTDTWDFNITPYTQGWKAYNVDDFSVEDGKYFIDPAGSNPYIQLDGLLLDAGIYDAFLINISSNCQDTEAAIYFNTTTSPEYGEGKKLPFEVSNSGDWYLFVVFTEHPLWKDMITGIRIQPANEGIPGDNSDIVGFESIELIQIIGPPPIPGTYVPDDYPTIQAAIDSASEGDTIIVREGTYIENVKVNKNHLTIRSENGAETTIVQAVDPSDYVFEVTADYVNISRFTAKGGSRGIFLYQAGYCNISDNIASNNDIGIFFSETENSRIENVAVLDSSYGIVLGYSNNNILNRNNVLDNYRGACIGISNNNNFTNNTVNSSERYGIMMYLSTDNTFTNNTISNNYHGIMLISLSGNILTRNSFSGNYYGIWMKLSNDNEIYLNDSTDNTDSICYYRLSSLDNIWNSSEKITYTYNGNTYTNYLGNYWDDYTDIDASSDGIWDNPYDIYLDKDNYSLVEPWEN